MTEKKNPATEAAVAEGPLAATQIDQAIAGVEEFYRTLTSSSPPPVSESVHASIPVERDPSEFVSEQLDRLLTALGEPVSATAEAWRPPLSVWEGDREMVLCLDLPGVSRQELKLSLRGNALIVRGRRATGWDGLRLALNERSLGVFERTILLPERVAADEPRAELKAGVLEIRLAKLQPEPVAFKEIPVA